MRLGLLFKCVARIYDCAVMGFDLSRPQKIAGIVDCVRCVPMVSSNGRMTTKGSTCSVLFVRYGSRFFNHSLDRRDSLRGPFLSDIPCICRNRGCSIARSQLMDLIMVFWLMRLGTCRTIPFALALEPRI